MDYTHSGVLPENADLGKPLFHLVSSGMGCVEIYTVILQSKHSGYHQQLLLLVHIQQRPSRASGTCLEFVDVTPLKDLSDVKSSLDMSQPWMHFSSSSE